MRLGQLARKLEEKPTKILDFLKQEHGIELEDTLNTKLDDELIEMITSHFKPEINSEVEEIIEDKKIEEEIALIKEKESPISEKEVVEEKEINIEKMIVQTETDEEIELLIENGIIKAPKKELEGPKVLGKIELPKGPQKLEFIFTYNNETKNITEHIESLRNNVKNKNNSPIIKSNISQNKNKAQKQNKPKSSIKDFSLDEIKRKELEIFEKNKKDREEKLKEIRTKKYQENILKKVQEKNQVQKKKRKKLVSQSQSEKKAQKPEPTTKLGKIWRWFNT